MPLVADKYRPKKSYHDVYHRLISAARHRGSVTYQELAKILGLPLQGNYMQGEIGHVLGEISEDEHNHGRPMLSAVAVSNRGLPGPGFFVLARQLGRISTEVPGDERQFWEAEKAAVCSAWAEDLDTYVPRKR